MGVGIGFWIVLQAILSYSFRMSEIFFIIWFELFTRFSVKNNEFWNIESNPGVYILQNTMVGRGGGVEEWPTGKINGSRGKNCKIYTPVFCTGQWFSALVLNPEPPHSLIDMSTVQGVWANGVRSTGPDQEVPHLLPGSRLQQAFGTSDPHF